MVFKRSKKIALLVITVIAISLMQPVIVLAENSESMIQPRSSKIVPVTRYQQESMVWCWAATAQMLGAYFGNYQTQSTISAAVKGTVTAQTASLTEVNSAISYTTKRSVSTLGQIPMTDIVNRMDNNIPLGIRVQWNNTSGSGHTLVLHGYNNGYVYLTDPWYGCGTTWVSYVDLCSGVTIQSGNGYLAQTFYM